MPNTAPVAVNDGVFNSHHGEQLNVAAVDGVLKNDTDADFDTLTAVLDIGPMYGTSFTLHASGAFDYVPDPAYSGPITFTYYAFDGTDYSSIATVTINVYWTAAELYTAYQGAVGDADDDYAGAVNAAISTRNGDIAALRAAVPGDAASLYTTYQGAFGTAQSTYTGAVGDAETAYNGAVADANNAWTTAYEDAGDAYDAAMNAAQGTYNTTMTNLGNGYDSAIADADAAYNYAQNVVIPALEAARDAAYIAWQLDVENTTLQEAYNTAQSAVGEAISMASSARDTAYGDAQTTRDNGENMASSDLTSAQGMAQSDYDNDLADADQAWEMAEGMAWSTYTSAKTSADEAFTGAESDAWSMYVSSLAMLLSTLASAEESVVGAFNSVVDMALSAWQSAEGDAWSTYTAEMAYVPGSPSLDTRITAPAAVTDGGVGAFEGVEEGDRLEIEDSEGDDDETITFTANDDSFTSIDGRIVTIEISSLMVVTGNPESISLVIVSGPANGVILVSGLTIDYIPGPGYFGGDAITYKLTDGSAESNEATISISITNEAPTASNYGPVSIVKNSAVVLDVNQVIFGATNGDGDRLAFCVVDGPEFGTLTILDDGSILYVPDPDYTGSDSFTYKLQDAFSESATATVSLVVVDEYVVANDVYFASQSTSEYYFWATDLVSNASTFDSLLPTLIKIGGTLLTSLSTATLASGATVTSLGDGAFKYVSAALFLGVDSFTFTISHNSVDATATIHMLVTENPPVLPRLGQPIPLNTTLAGVLSLKFNDWKDGAGNITLTKINELIASRNLRVEEAAAVAVLKAYVMENPANLAQLGRFSTLFSMSPTQLTPRWITAAGVTAFQTALGNATPAAQFLETKYQEILQGLAVDVTTHSLFPNGRKPEDFFTLVRQGAIGDCSFLSAVIGYLHQGNVQNLINRIRLVDSVNGVTRYDVDLYSAAGQITTVRVEEPTYAERALYAGTTDGSRWLSILEKAYVTQWPRDPAQLQATANQSIYDVAANGERMDNAILRVTGRGAGLQGLPRFALPIELRLRILLNNVNFGKVVLAGSKSTAAIAAINNPLLVAFPSNHAFAVIAFNSETGMVTLRNPWNGQGNFGAQFNMSLANFRSVFATLSVQT